jgi:hypothetical protein
VSEVASGSTRARACPGHNPQADPGIGRPPNAKRGGAGMTYATMIEDLAPPGHDPRHIEAIMRLRNPTLDGLLPGEFRKEVSVAVACIANLEP